MKSNRNAHENNGNACEILEMLLKKLNPIKIIGKRKYINGIFTICRADWFLFAFSRITICGGSFYEKCEFKGGTSPRY